MLNNIPAHLFCGDENTIVKIILENLQKTFCKKQISECLCNECRQIKNNQHHSIVWVEPEKSYLLSNLSVIFEKTKFALSPEQEFFFILKKSHLLTNVCANKLLKILEEPPPGYKFLLITNNANSIIPTIRSRCHIHNIKSQSNELLINPLLTFFLDPTKSCPVEFENELKKQKLSEQESINLIQTLVEHFYKKIIENNNEKVTQKLIFFQKQLRKPPQAGSADLFWKNLFVQKS